MGFTLAMSGGNEVGFTLAMSGGNEVGFTLAMSGGNEWMKSWKGGRVERVLWKKVPRSEICSLL